MSSAIIKLTEVEDGTVNLTAEFDPPVQQGDLDENFEHLGEAVKVALGMVSWAKEELAPDEDAVWRST